MSRWGWLFLISWPDRTWRKYHPSGGHCRASRATERRRVLLPLLICCSAQSSTDWTAADDEVASPRGGSPTAMWRNSQGLIASLHLLYGARSANHSLMLLLFSAQRAHFWDVSPTQHVPPTFMHSLRGIWASFRSLLIFRPLSILRRLVSLTPSALTFLFWWRCLI